MSITHGEEDRLWSCVEQEMKSLETGQTGPAIVKTKGKKKQVNIMSVQVCLFWVFFIIKPRYGKSGIMLSDWTAKSLKSGDPCKTKVRWKNSKRLYLGFRKLYSRIKTIFVNLFTEVEVNSGG